MKSLKIGVLIMLLLSILFTMGCDDGYAEDEEELVAKNQSTLLKIQPPVTLNWSLERYQINKRTKLWNNRVKVAFIYLIDKGSVVANFTIEGKVSSVNSQITNPQRRNSGGHGAIALPSPAEDGSYGSNGYGVFFFTTTGTYVEWNGVYMLADTPLRLRQKPVLIKVENE